MTFLNYFDAVIMLTWSNWETEPRSNRYHYATRFAKSVPVIFIQNQKAVEDGVIVSSSEISNLDLVNVSAPIRQNEVEVIIELLRSRGIKRPLVWIYDSINYECLLSVMPKWLRVYHATEDYFTESFAMQTESSVVSNSVKKLLEDIDLVVAVSDAVLGNLITASKYDGESIVADNACDFKVISNLQEEHANSICPITRTVVYQGGVNYRLDYELLKNLALQLPDYKFKIVGRSVASDGLNKFAEFNNVELLGELTPDLVCLEMLRAEIGIIPFVQDQWIRNSFPLKFFEYVACGLPVVSVPIDALSKFQDVQNVIRFARSAEEFADAIKKLSSSRYDLQSLSARKILASNNSYDERFERVSTKIIDVVQHQRCLDEPFSIAILYDPTSCHVSTIREHLDAFKRYSENDITYIPATYLWGIKSDIKLFGDIDFTLFDAVVVHYTIRISLLHHLHENMAVALQKFTGLKILFVQDEYEYVERARAWMDRLKFDLVYTCVPLDQRELVYPEYRFSQTEFLPTLTGYVPESKQIDKFVTPLDERLISIAYRGRALPPIYGRLGHEKFTIGIMVKELAEKSGLNVDISCEEKDRIYGNEWYQFLGSARATLGTESGSNIFDFDGAISKKINHEISQRGSLQFDEIWNQLLKEHDGKVRMNQISPKIFEAIKLRTALVLFEGDYSGVVKSNIHYIPLKKDFSNFDHVVKLLQDDSFVRQMTEKAYEDIILSGKYSYRQFVEGVDRDIRERCLRRVKRQLMYGLMYFKNRNDEFRQCFPAIPLGLTCASDTLNNQISLQVIQEKFRYALFESLKGQGFEVLDIIDNQNEEVLDVNHNQNAEIIDSTDNQNEEVLNSADNQNDGMDIMHSQSGWAQDILNNPNIEPQNFVNNPVIRTQKRLEVYAITINLVKKMLVRFGIPPLKKIHSLAKRNSFVRNLSQIVYDILPLRVRVKIAEVLKGG